MSKKQYHTKLGTDADGRLLIAIRSPEGTVISTVMLRSTTGPEWDGGKGIEQAEADAQRIVDALNAYRGEKAVTTDLNTPWSLHFDRDGTEDFGIICDAEGNDLVASHLPCTKMQRWKNREFGEGCFWLPEKEGDEMPTLVRQMQLMTAAPQLLEACRMVVARWKNGDMGEAARECQAAVALAETLLG